MNHTIVLGAVAASVMLSASAHAEPDQKSQPFTIRMDAPERPVSYEPPGYPRAALRAKHEGKCTVAVRADRTGSALTIGRPDCSHRIFQNEFRRFVSSLVFDAPANPDRAPIQQVSLYWTLER